MYTVLCELLFNKIHLLQFSVNGSDVRNKTEEDNTEMDGTKKEKRERKKCKWILRKETTRLNVIPKG